MNRVVVCALLTAALSGCVGTLQTAPYRERTELTDALPGVSYSLPKIRYEVKLKRALAECPGEVRNGKPTALKFSVTAQATPEYLQAKRTRSTTRSYLDS